MVRLVGLATLIVSALGSRVKVHDEAETSVAATTARGLEVLEQLKKTPTDVSLQNEYSELIGDVEFHESRVFLETGANIQQEPVALGAQSASGQVLTMVERTGFLESLGRFLTNRRDYVFEEEGGHSKYVLDGRIMSMHTRMHVSVVGETNPRFILRRAFNYLNPVSTIFGQFVYRVIQCTDASEGACSEGEYLYTITKDRLGRGALWGMDEYRVYTGTGGCSRYNFGIVSCDQEAQVLYSLGAGLSEATFDTDFYKGKIITISPGLISRWDSGTVQRDGDSVQVDAADLASMRIGHSTKVEGPPRWLNWVSPIVPWFGAGLEFARAAIWTDSYRLRFFGEADELLVSLMAAAQDLTRDTITSQHVASHLYTGGVNGAFDQYIAHHNPPGTSGTHYRPQTSSRRWRR